MLRYDKMFENLEEFFLFEADQFILILLKAGLKVPKCNIASMWCMAHCFVQN